LTVSLELFKDITLEFTQDYTPFKIRCPICVIEKKYIGHCKFKKNLTSCWQHIQKEHANDVETSYHPKIKEAIVIFNAIHKALRLGIIPDKKYINNVPTTSSSLVYDGKPISRRDVSCRLIDIADLLLCQSKSYPKDFRLKQLKGLIKVATRKNDPRTIDKYFDCVVRASIKDIRRGTFDVRKFVECTKVWR